MQQTCQNSKQNNTSIWNEGQENVHEGVMIGFGFTFEWMTKWQEFFKATAQHSNANPKKMQVTFDTLEKIALTYY